MPDASEFSGISPFDIGFQLGMGGMRRNTQGSSPVGVRSNGISADGLSYSVALDRDKAFGNAAAEYEARLKNPRAGGYDSPEALDREILSPLRSLFGMGERKTIPQKTFEVGGNIVQVDPDTGKTKTVFTAPQTVKEHRYSGPTGMNLLGNSTGTASWTLPEWGKWGPGLPDSVRTNAPVSNYIAEAARLAQPAAAVPSRPSFGFIGSEGGSNAFAGPSAPAAQASPSSRWVRGPDGKITLSK